MNVTPENLASRIEHTILAAEARPDQVEQVCREAVQHRFFGVCVNPRYVAQAVGHLDGTGIRVVTVCGFPLGATDSRTKAAEAAQAVRDGAAEVDMVVWIGGLLAGRYTEVEADIAAVVGAVRASREDAAVKVILETAALDETAIVAGCRCALGGEADFVKTSTGYHKAGGATVEAVQLLRAHAGPMGVKAAGGIRDLATALAMIEAGADRLGTSSGAKIVQELQGKVL
jgi:deoxyribose-phosphate aldolase